jgi:chemotaxis signal transduction protein
MTPKPSLSPYPFQAVVFPSSETSETGDTLFFIFSIHQVREIKSEITILPIPFSEPFIKGISEWRNRVVPVISLERRLEIKKNSNPESRRYALIQSKANGTSNKSLFAFIETGPGIRHLSPPVSCTTVFPGEFTPNPSLVHAAYKWEAGVLMAPDMMKILNSGG